MTAPDPRNLRTMPRPVTPLLMIIAFQYLIGCGKQAFAVPENVAAVSCTILTDQPIYQMEYGYGVNVTSITQSLAVEAFGVELGSSHCPLPEPDDEARWQEIFKWMDWSGLDWIRLKVEMNAWAPERGHYTWDSPDMLRAIRFLAWAQSRGVDVLLQQQSHATRWNSLPDQNPGNSAPRDLDAFAEAFTTMVEYLVKQRGFSCIRSLNIANEPMNHWGWWKGGDVRDGYAAVRKELDKQGITLPLAGTEYFEGVKDGDRVVDWWRHNSNWEHCKPYLGIWENHEYAYSQQGIYSPRPIPDRDIPILWGEFAGSDNTHYNWNIDVARWQIGSPQNGIDGFARWSYFNRDDLDGRFAFVQTMDRSTGKMLDRFVPAPNLYWMDGALSRYTAKGSRIYASSADHDALTATLFQSPSGHWTLVAVNNDPVMALDTKFHFQSWSEKRVFHRYAVTTDSVRDRTEGVRLEADATFELTAEQQGLSDRLPPLSIVVYSDRLLAHDAPGISSDGEASAFDPVVVSRPHEKIIDHRDRTLQWQGEWAESADSAYRDGWSKHSRAEGSAMTFEFEGTGFRLFGQRDNGSGWATVELDGQFIGYASAYAPVTIPSTCLFDSGNLPQGRHRVKVRLDGRRSMTGGGPYFNLDAVGLRRELRGDSFRRERR
jgi:hypothetical protein